MLACGAHQFHQSVHGIGHDGRCCYPNRLFEGIKPGIVLAGRDGDRIIDSGTTGGSSAWIGTFNADIVGSTKSTIGLLSVFRDAYRAGGWGFAFEQVENVVYKTRAQRALSFGLRTAVKATRRLSTGAAAQTMRPPNRVR